MRPAPFSTMSSSVSSALALGAGALLLLAGCKGVGPDYHGPPKPEQPEPTRFKNASSGGTGRWKIAEPKDQAGRGAWWEIFRDPVLNHLEEAAQANNQDLRLALARIDQSRAQTRVAASDFYPHFDYNGSYVRQRTSNNEPVQRGEALNLGSLIGGESGGTTGGGAAGGAGDPGGSVLFTQPLTRTYSLFRQPVDLTWEVDLFGRVRRSYENARAQRESVEADYENVRLSVAANVANMYFNLRALDLEIVVIQRIIKSLQGALDIAKERLNAGLTGELDVQQEVSLLASNEADLAGVQRSRSGLENALATVVGQPASTFRFPPRALSYNAVPPRVPAGLPSSLLERRPDVASAERQLAAANAQIGVALAAFFPRITVTGAAGFESATITDLFNWQSHIWQIGPSVSLPIFEGGRNQANLDSARAQYNQQVARYRGQVLTAFQDVETALSDLRHLATQSAAQDRAVDASRRSLELSRKQFGQGSVDFLNVVDSERNVFNTERTAAQLRGQRMQATVQLIKALGGGWQ